MSVTVTAAAGRALCRTSFSTRVGVSVSANTSGVGGGGGGGGGGAGPGGGEREGAVASIAGQLAERPLSGLAASLFQNLAHLPWACHRRRSEANFGNYSGNGDLFGNGNTKAQKVKLKNLLFLGHHR